MNLCWQDEKSFCEVINSPDVTYSIVANSYKGKDFIRDLTDQCKKGLISQEMANLAIASHYKMPIIDNLNGYCVDEQLLKKVPSRLMRLNTTFIIRDENTSEVLLLTANPSSQSGLSEVMFSIQETCQLSYAERPFIIDLITQYYDKDEVMMLSAQNDSYDSSSEIDDQTQSEVSSPAVQVVELIIREAIQKSVSDIHFTPNRQHNTTVQFRIDGILMNQHLFAKDYKTGIPARLKVLSSLDVAETRLPQDGRLLYKYMGKSYDIRVSTIPVLHGERVVLRILNIGDSVVSLDTVGFPEQDLRTIKSLCKRTEGMILLTGPTGSGKTTTLYAMINGMNISERNIMTLEDPVEREINGIAQIPIQNSINMTFPRALRHVLRQDPDVIMVGELRDLETVSVAIQASLTGHLVLGTLHTIDAASAVIRLHDMGVDKYRINSALMAVVAQRLVRVLCNHCKKPQSDLTHACKELGIQSPVGYKAVGCSECSDIGYLGRNAIYEIFLPSDATREALKASSIDAMQLKTTAEQDGMIPMSEYGKRLVLEGITTAEEVLRVTSR